MAGSRMVPPGHRRPLPYIGNSMSGATSTVPPRATCGQPRANSTAASILSAWTTVACQRVGAATVADPVWTHGLRRPDSQAGLDGLVAGPRHTGLPFRHMLGAVRGRAKVRARVIGK